MRDVVTIKTKAVSDILALLTSVLPSVRQFHAFVRQVRPSVRPSFDFPPARCPSVCPSIPSSLPSFLPPLCLPPHPSDRPSVFTSVRPSSHRPVDHPSVHPSSYPSVSSSVRPRPFVCPHIRSSAYDFVRPLICLPDRPSIRPSTCPPVPVTVVRQFACPNVNPSAS